MDAIREIFQEYADGLGIDLCFQQFDAELAGLPGEYQEPRGGLLMAHVGGELAGCCALRPLDNADYPNAAEMKRLYVRKAFRGFGLGRQLSEAILDTARSLYDDLGFVEIAPYYHNPISGAHYLKVDL